MLWSKRYKCSCATPDKRTVSFEVEGNYLVIRLKPYGTYSSCLNARKCRQLSKALLNFAKTLEKNKESGNYDTDE